MEKIRIGVMCPSEIAFRRFMPALKKIVDFEYIGLAAATEQEFSGTGSDQVKPSELEKAKAFISVHGGKIFEGYDALIRSDEVDAIYLPLPPALHYKWGKKVLENSKHLLMEKPFTTSSTETTELLSLAEEKGLAVHENYMFLYHSQLGKIKELIADGTLGELRLIRASFGFPMRGKDDFRYKKAMGGGALLDCGGYPVRLALELLGDTAQVTQSRLVQPEGHEVDLYGNAVLENADGLCAQISFGMDNAYQCQLEVWGSKAILIVPRVFTAPAGFDADLEVKENQEVSQHFSISDNSFKNSLLMFKDSILKENDRKGKMIAIQIQSDLIEKIAIGG